MAGELESGVWMVRNLRGLSRTTNSGCIRLKPAKVSDKALENVYTETPGLSPT